MSYGTLSKNPINHYNKIYYTIGRTTFEPIHVFKTNPNSESIAPAVCLTDSKKHLSEMNPPTAVIGSTANVMAKLAHGLADDMLTTTVLASRAPKIIAPAMNTAMYENPVTQDNIE